MNGNSKNIYIFDLNFLYKSNGYLCILYKLLLLQEIEMILSRVDTYNQTLLMLKAFLLPYFIYKIRLFWQICYNCILIKIFLGIVKETKKVSPIFAFFAFPFEFARNKKVIL